DVGQRDRRLSIPSVKLQSSLIFPYRKIAKIVEEIIGVGEVVALVRHWGGIEQGDARFAYLRPMRSGIAVHLFGIIRQHADLMDRVRAYGLDAIGVVHD